jgi:hypothetical protein
MHAARVQQGCGASRRDRGVARDVTGHRDVAIAPTAARYSRRIQRQLSESPLQAALGAGTGRSGGGGQEGM